jgi:Domain of unknown function (DUF1929)
LSTTTHAFDSGQRFFEISLQRSSSAPDVLRLLAPGNPNLMPPGHYLLTIIDGNGVPSVSRIVQLVFGARTQAPGSKVQQVR